MFLEVNEGETGYWYCPVEIVLHIQCLCYYPFLNNLLHAVVSHDKFGALVYVEVGYTLLIYFTNVGYTLLKNRWLKEQYQKQFEIATRML